MGSVNNAQNGFKSDVKLMRIKKMTDKKNNFAKDINVPSKEQIIIDGETENCKILFCCKHIDDLAAYNMICNGIKITPENAPIGDLELMLIENTNSPFGFSAVCKRNSKENVWEYSGFGHSGACSIITALLRQLAHKTQELKTLKNNEDLLISNLQILWGTQIAVEQGDCKNIDYSKPRTREIYLKISEIDQTLKDVAFAQSVKLGKTKPLGDTGSPRSYKRWEKREQQLLEREFLK